MKVRHPGDQKPGYKKSYLELNPKLQDYICDGIRRGCTIQSLMESVGIAPRNYWVWHRRGKKQLRGIMRDFYNAVEQAKIERWSNQKPELEKVVYKGATETRVAVTRKIERIMILSREDRLLLEEKYEESPELEARFKKDGVILKETVHKVEILPHISTALQILARKSPDEWGKKS